jgi:hypothetical protein
MPATAEKAAPGAGRASGFDPFKTYSRRILPAHAHSLPVSR